MNGKAFDIGAVVLAVILLLAPKLDLSRFIPDLGGSEPLPESPVPPADMAPYSTRITALLSGKKGLAEFQCRLTYHIAKTLEKDGLQPSPGVTNFSDIRELNRLVENYVYAGTSFVGAAPGISAEMSKLLAQAVNGDPSNLAPTELDVAKRARAVQAYLAISYACREAAK